METSKTKQVLWRILEIREVGAVLPLGNGFEMTVVAGAVIGGISMAGGAGSMFGMALGAFCMAMITNGMTLMKVLSGAYAHHSYSGEIFVNDQPVQFQTQADSSAAGIEMIYQEISVHLDLTVAENIFLGRVPVKNGVVQWKQMFRDAKTYMDMVGLSVPANMFMHNLSASQCQMVCIARALSRNPKILVLDEPTSPLTEKEVEALFQILFKLRDRGISCIYISHKMKEIMRLADRVCVMRDGQHIWTKDASELTIDAIVESMVNRKIGNMYPKEVFELGEEVFSIKNL